jgi:hypothetical protein
MQMHRYGVVGWKCSSPEPSIDKGKATPFAETQALGMSDFVACKEWFDHRIGTKVTAEISTDTDHSFN